MLQAGKLNRIIAIESPVVGKGASGGKQTQWVPFASGVPAAVRHLSGTEKPVSSAGGQVAEARTEFIIRWRPGVNARMRVLYDGAIYNIRHANDFSARRESLILTCDTGANNG